MISIEVIGWLGSICFTLCGLPQAIACIKQGHGNGLSKTFLWLWFLGEIFMLNYTIFKLNMDGPLTVNLATNIIFILIIFRYVYFPKVEMKPSCVIS